MGGNTMNQNEVYLQWTGKRKPHWDSGDCQILQTTWPHPNQTLTFSHRSRPEISNQLLIGTDHQVMAWLLANGYQQSFDCIYLDPPYLSDNKYYAQLKIEIDSGVESIKQQVFHDDGYRDQSAYLQHLYQTASMARELLSEQGSLFAHLDWHSSHYVKVMLDEIFTPHRFINEIVWCYGGGSGTRSHFHRKHDVILWYSRGADYIFNPQYRPYSPGTLQRGLTRVKGDRYKLDSRGALLQDWWSDIPKILSPTAVNNWKFPTQKPVELLERIIKSATLESSLVGDFYAGSGTTAEACERLGRPWVISDNNIYAIQTSLHRLVRSNSNSFVLGTVNGEPDVKGKLWVKTEIIPQLFGNEYTVTLQSYQPDDRRAASLSWLDFWELGWMEENRFISMVQAVPVKRGQDLPLTLTFRIDQTQTTQLHNLVVQAWDIQGGLVRQPLVWSDQQ